MTDAISFDTISADVPMLLVPATAGDGEPLTVVVDTGATPPFPLIVSEALAKRLGLSLEAGETAATPAIGPRPPTLRKTQVPRFTMGPISLSDVPAIATEAVDRLAASIGRPVDAIVGHAFLKELTFSVDYGAKLIDFTAAPGADSEAISFTLGPKKPVMVVTATVNGKGPFAMELDTGAMASSATPKLAEQAAIDVRGSGRMSGPGGDIPVHYGHASVGFAGRTAEAQQFAISEAIERIAQETGAPIEGIIGARFFAGTRVTIAYPDGKMWVEPSGGADAP